MIITSSFLKLKELLILFKLSVPILILTKFLTLFPYASPGTKLILFLNKSFLHKLYVLIFFGIG